MKPEAEPTKPQKALPLAPDEHLFEPSGLRRALDKHAAVALTDLRGVILEVNSQFCELSGYSRHELIGNDHRIVNSGLHEREFFRDLWSAISQGHTWQGNICNRKKSGELYWVRTTIVPQHNEQGAISGYLALRTDISEQVRAEESLQTERLALQQKNTVLNEVISTIEKQKEDFRASLAANIERAVLPLLDRLQTRSFGVEKKVLNLLRSSLEEISQPLRSEPSFTARRLSRKERQVDELARRGLTAKETAEFMGVSHRTVEKHRENIRKKQMRRTTSPLGS